MIIQPLRGLGILITRPATGATGDIGTFAARVRAAGGQPYHLPTLCIEARDVQAPALSDYQTLIFISRNAVLYGVDALGGAAGIEAARRAGLRVAAVGGATAAELSRAGITVDCCPSGQASSEALLAEPEMQAPGAVVLIVRGEGGRETLAAGLRERGARVDYLEVYARLPAPWSHELSPAELLARVDVILLTSVDVLNALVALLEPLPPAAWRGKRLVVGSARMIPEVERLGFSAAPRVASQPTDEAMFAALLTGRWPARPAAGGGAAPTTTDTQKAEIR